MLMNTVPKSDGFRMPGEFEPHQGCWMLWPERGDTWRLGGQPARKVFAQIAETIVKSEEVTVCVSANQFDNARKLLPDAIRLVEMSSNDAWMRDVGPTFVSDKKGRIRGVDWHFNAWGGLKDGLYFPWDRDAAVAKKILEMERIDRYRAPLILEGGSIHADGQGTVITTEECLLHPNRNPGLSKQEIENFLKDYLNAVKVIWLKKGVFMDETDGHVDNLCCFVRPGEVLLTWTNDPSDPQYAISRHAFDILSNTTDAKGRKPTVHKIHQPGPLYLTGEESSGLDFSGNAMPRTEGHRLAASYVNFYIANNTVVMPVFNDPHDDAAVDTISRLFPEREVTAVYAREILLGGGNIHCITQQQPQKAVRE